MTTLARLDGPITPGGPKLMLGDGGNRNPKRSEHSSGRWRLVAILIVFALVYYFVRNA